MEDILSRVGIGSSFLISFFNEGEKTGSASGSSGLEQK